MDKRVIGVGVVALGCLSAVSAFGQCGEWDGQLAAVPSFTNSPQSGVAWDPDGAGPQPSRLVIAGQMTVSVDGQSISFLAMWNGSEWQSLGVFDSFISVVRTWDPDGTGPLAPRLVVGGEFTRVNNMQVNHIAVYDGATWAPLGTGMSPTFDDVVERIESWDMDGAGPLPPQLVALGRFVFADGVQVNNIARWDGTAWHALGSGILFDSVGELTIWDSDGSGPLNPEVIAGGSFSTAGGVPALNIARWNGSVWQAFSPGSLPGDGFVVALGQFDPDGTGPNPAQLIVGHRYFQAPGVVAYSVLRWTAGGWVSFGPNGFSAIAFSSWDADAVGPNPPVLVASGFSAGGLSLIEWNGSTWSTFAGSQVPGFHVSDLVHLDPDGAGPRVLELVAVGSFSTAGGAPIARIARWNGSSWLPFSKGPEGPVKSLASWDPDGEGPLVPRLVAGGDFLMERETTVNRVAQWDGTQWLPVGEGFNARVNSLLSIDPDGTGPLEKELIAGGSFTASGATAVSRVSRWDGAAWQAQGSGVNDEVLAMAAFDPDGSASIPDRLTIAGEFVNVANFNGDHVVRWNGTAWQTMGAGVPEAASALVVWDRDGPGGLNPEILAGGAFNAIFEADDYIRRWTGVDWAEYASNLNGEVLTLATWDPDGAGVLNDQLIAGGVFTSANGTPVNGVARWDGAAWHALGSGVAGGLADVYTALSVDVDGNGPQDEVLVIGGHFSSAGGVTANNLAWWDGTTWHAFGTGTNGAVRALAMWDPDGPGVEQPQLVIGGDFTQVDGQALRYVALWSTLTPQLISQPADIDVDVGQSAGFGVGSEGSSLTYQWRRNGESLVNGTTPSGSVLVNVTSYAMLVQNAQEADAGEYDCVVTGACGNVTSEAATLTVNPPPPECAGDANGDFLVNGADLSVLLGLFGTAVTPGTGADFNGDGLVNGADLSVLLGLFGSAC